MISNLDGGARPVSIVRLQLISGRLRKREKTVFASAVGGRRCSAEHLRLRTTDNRKVIIKTSATTNRDYPVRHFFALNPYVPGHCSKPTRFM